jgi:large subunit ribosomal protein L25
MQTVPLKATTRTENGKGPARRLRVQGLVPSVAYGGDNATDAISVGAEPLREILLSPRGRNTIIELQVEGAGKYAVMLKEYTVHPLTRKLLHADFVRVIEGKTIKCEVPFDTVGKSKGEVDGGTLLTSYRNLPVRCIPANIPDSLTHDVSALEIDDVVRVQELTLPDGIEVLLPPEFKIVSVQPPRVIEEPTVEGEEGEAVEGEAAEGEGADGEGKDDDDKSDDKDKKDKKKDKKDKKD